MDVCHRHTARDRVRARAMPSRGSSDRDAGGATPRSSRRGRAQQIAAPADVEALGTALVEAGCQSQFQRLAVNTFQD